MRAVISVAAIVSVGLGLAIAACTQPSETRHTGQPTGPAAGSGHAVQTQSPTKGGTGGAGGGSGEVARDVPCPTPSCAYHAASAAYFTCLSGGSGTCFHFGARCTPSDSCMYDATDRTYKKCTAALEGTCRTWAASCEPASRCMFDGADGLYHHCDDASGGGCKRWGGLCAP